MIREQPSPTITINTRHCRFYFSKIKWRRCPSPGEHLRVSLFPAMLSQSWRASSSRGVPPVMISQSFKASWSQSPPVMLSQSWGSSWSRGVTPATLSQSWRSSWNQPPPSDVVSILKNLNLRVGLLPTRQANHLRFSTAERSWTYLKVLFPQVS